MRCTVAERYISSWNGREKISAISSLLQSFRTVDSIPDMDLVSSFEYIAFLSLASFGSRSGDDADTDLVFEDCEEDDEEEEAAAATY
mmetsp:Transcript_46281/g.68252  ORF Transcript_46281/g.68252 Transcript_46281/m.68252 type:complete len:87 (-) Transcript_46281:268-528(-)